MASNNHLPDQIWGLHEKEDYWNQSGDDITTSHCLAHSHFRAQLFFLPWCWSTGYNFNLVLRFTPKRNHVNQLIYFVLYTLGWRISIVIANMIGWNSFKGVGFLGINLIVAVGLKFRWTTWNLKPPELLHLFSSILNAY